MTAFAIPVAAKEVLALLCQLRGVERDHAWTDFQHVTASGDPTLYSPLWTSIVRHLGLVITGEGDPAPVPHAIRESYDPLTNRAAWRT